jgi:hypothetical protein
VFHARFVARGSTAEAPIISLSASPLAMDAVQAAGTKVRLCSSQRFFGQRGVLIEIAVRPQAPRVVQVYSSIFVHVGDHGAKGPLLT